jgi:hypothetical protein
MSSPRTATTRWYRAIVVRAIAGHLEITDAVFARKLRRPENGREVIVLRPGRDFRLWPVATARQYLELGEAQDERECARLESEYARLLGRTQENKP